MDSRQPVRGMVLQVYAQGGTIRSLRFNGIPILDAHGVFQGYRGTGTDITEEIAARWAADVAHARLSDAIGALPAAFLLWDADERLVLWNERAVDFLPDIAGHLVPGLSLAEYAEFAGDAVVGRGSPERERWIRDRIALFRDPPPSREFQRLDGRRLRILERRTSEGGTVSVHLDVSEESHARNAAEVAVARLTDAIEALPAAFLLWDADERLILRNNRALALFPDAADWMKPGIAFEAYVRQAVQSWGGDPAEDVEAFVQRRIEIFRNPPVSLELRRTDGRWVQIHEHRTSEGGVASMLFDITEQKSREHQLRQAQKMEAVGQLTAGVAHDFNNLLQVVLGYAMMVKRALGPHHAAGEMMEHIRAAGQRGADLTQQLLTFSRNQVMQAGRLNLNQTIANQVKMLERMVGERIQLETRFDPRLEDLHGDRGMIGQAIMNLVINARDAMPAGGKIVVSTEALEADARFRYANVWAKPGPYAAIRCEDTGSGMSPEVLARIFEPFFTTKKLGEGTGLGLAIVYGIAQQHGGMVSAQSEPGRGTTITIFLPVYPPEGPVPPEERAAPKEGQSQTVLVAEDSDAVRELLQRVLTEHGYQVLAVPNGEQAVDEFSRHGDRIDLVLLDIVMPGMGGISARKQILQLRPGTRILFASGWSSKEDQASIQLEGVPFLRKPFSAEALLQAVHDVLHRGEAVH
jgi:signal transduction histidine kinase/ActR/RegA family two-component response regulator